MKFQESSPVLSIPDIILLIKAAAGKSGQERENKLYSILKTSIFSWWCSRVWYERQQKDFLKFISNSHIILWFHLLFIRNQSVNMFIHHRVSRSKTIPDFRLKWAKSITAFKPKRRKNHTNFFLKDNNSF